MKAIIAKTVLMLTLAASLGAGLYAAEKGCCDGSCCGAGCCKTVK